MRAEAALRGFLVGGGLGALLFYLSTEQDDAEERGPKLVSYEAYPHVAADAALQSILLEPMPLFASVDPGTAESLLLALEDLNGTYASCRSQAAPALLSRAIQARRKASAALGRLVRAARQTKPLEASELSEDIKALQKHLADTVHNVDQEIGFQLASRT